MVWLPLPRNDIELRSSGPHREHSAKSCEMEISYYKIAVCIFTFVIRPPTH
jgi:hypothetical protein